MASKKQYLIPGLFLLGFGTAMAFAFGGGDSPAPSPEPSPEPEPEPVPTPSDDDAAIRKLVRDLHVKWNMPDILADFELAKMRRESGFNRLVMCGEIVPERAKAVGVFIRPSATAAERRAAASAASIGFDRNRNSYADCVSFGGGVNPPEEYTAGSYGLLGFLPSSALEAWVKTPMNCISPVEMFAVGPQVIAGWAFMARVEANRAAYRNGGRTMEDMAVGWASPSSIGEDNDFTRAVKARFAADLKAVAPSRSPKDKMPSLVNNNGHWAGLLADWFDMAGRLA